MQGRQQWWGIQHGEHRKLEELFKRKGCEPYVRSEIYPVPEEVLQSGIPVHGAIQSAGDCMIIPATVYHWGHAEVSSSSQVRFFPTL